MSDEWVGVIHATRPKFMKGATDLTIRKRLLLSLLKKKGRLEFNDSGDECKWQIEFSQPPVESYADGGVMDFSNHDAFRQVTNDWRGYKTTDTLSKKQQMMNKGQEALIDLFQTKSNRLQKSLTNKFQGELYRDGSAAGRQSCVHGLETFMQAGTVTGTDRIAAPNGTYGTGALACSAGGLGGSWTANLSTFPNASLATDWPDGQGSTEYDSLTPKLVNWSASNWGTGSTLWEDNCWRVISQAITWLTLMGGGDGMPDICVLAANLFQGYKNHEEAIRRILVPHKAANDLGLGNGILNQDGCAIENDFDCPAQTGYMLNTSFITLCSLWEELFWMEGPDKDPRSGYAWLWAMGFFGNVKYQPKHTAKLFNFA